MRIPFLDLDAGYRELQSELEDAVLRALRSGRYIGGAEVEAFEQEFAAYTGAAHCVALSNGLDALALALRAMGVGPGDEVIVPSNTFIATWFAVSQCGAVPVPVEPQETTGNIDAAGITAAITPRTRAIVPVHLYGQPANLQAIRALAARHGLPVLEDAAQAHGARCHGRRVGSQGTAAWSFYPGKNLGAYGDAGAVTTDDAVLADRLRALRNYGSQTKYVSDVQGGNHRLDPVQAAALRVKLRHLDSWNARRQRIAALYSEGLAATGLGLPEVPSWAEPVWHLYVVRSEQRDTLQQRLAVEGVETLIHYPIAPHRQRAYAGMDLAEGSLPVAERLARQVLSLPIGPQMTADQATAVLQAVQRAASA